MNAAHLHLAINHIPVIGIMFGIVFLLVALVTRNRVLIKSSLWIFFMVALLTIPVFLSGEPAEKMVENLPGISLGLIHDHEDAAEKAFYVFMFLGLVSLGGLLAARTVKHLSALYLFLVLLIAIITSVMIASAANQGGKIRHPEIGTMQSVDSDVGEHGGGDIDTADSAP